MPLHGLSKQPHLVYAGFNPHHYAVSEHLAILRQCLPGLQLGLVLEVHPVPRRRHLNTAADITTTGQKNRTTTCLRVCERERVHACYRVVKDVAVLGELQQDVGGRSRRKPETQHRHSELCLHFVLENNHNDSI